MARVPKMEATWIISTSGHMEVTLTKKDQTAEPEEGVALKKR